jgi:drug/metabolite transporter (DMT)-like permease
VAEFDAKPQGTVALDHPKTQPEVQKTMNRFFASRQAGFLYAIVAVALWAGNFLVARAFKSSIPPVGMNFLRWATACLVFTPFGLKAVLREWTVLRQHAAYIAATGLIGISLFNVLIYSAGRGTTAINMSLISVTFPIQVIVFSRFLFAERISRRRILGILVVVGGVVVLVTGGNLLALHSVRLAGGDLFMLAAATVFAIYSIMVRKKPAEVGLIAFQYATFVIGLIFLLPAFLVERLVAPALVLGWPEVGAILYIGIGASLVAFIAWNRAIQLIGASMAGIVYYLQPFFAGLLAFLFLGESLGLIHAVSGLLILGGIVLAGR